MAFKIRDAMKRLHLVSRKDCAYDRPHMQPGTIVLLQQLATKVVPPQPGIPDPGHNHVLVPLVVLVLVDSPLDKEEWELLACGVCHIQMKLMDT